MWETREDKFAWLGCWWLDEWWWDILVYISSKICYSSSLINLSWISKAPVLRMKPKAWRLYCM
jgi:hypothetical protein